MKLIALKAFILCILMIGSLQDSSGQIGLTRKEIIQKHGYNFKSGEASSGQLRYMAYEDETVNYEKTTVYYLIAMEDGTEKVLREKLLLPRSFADEVIRNLNQNFVKKGPMRWVSFRGSTTLVYELEIEKHLLSLTKKIGGD